jgi:predicted deacylase
MYKEILATLHKSSNILEHRGFLKEAYRIDIVSDLIAKIASNPSPTTLRRDFGLPEGDLDKAYLKKIRQIANKKGFSNRSLGDVGDTELLLIEPRKRNKGRNLLIIAGIHGDEQAAPFGLMRYFGRIGDETLAMTNLHFIPLYNPTGFRKCTRDNEWKEKTNRNYDNEKISRESKIIRDNLKMIKEVGKDGVLTMHEDPIAKVCYIYMYHGKDAKDLSEILLSVERMFFKQKSNIKADEEGGRAIKGVIWDRHEGSFEDWIRKKGVLQVATTETPGKEDFEHRVQANTMLLNAFVNYHIG